MVDFSGFPAMAAARVRWLQWLLINLDTKVSPMNVMRKQRQDDDCEIFGRSNAHGIVGNKVYDKYTNLTRCDASAVLEVPRFFFIKWRCLGGYSRSQPTYAGIDSGTVTPFIDLMHTGFQGNKVFDTNLARSDASTDLEVLRWI
jgi:hypothetical protein